MTLHLKCSVTARHTNTLSQSVQPRGETPPLVLCVPLLVCHWSLDTYSVFCIWMREEMSYIRFRISFTGQGHQWATELKGLTLESTSDSMYRLQSQWNSERGVCPWNLVGSFLTCTWPNTDLRFKNECLMSIKTRNHVLILWLSIRNLTAQLSDNTVSLTRDGWLY